MMQQMMRGMNPMMIMNMMGARGPPNPMRGYGGPAGGNMGYSRMGMGMGLGMGMEGNNTNSQGSPTNNDGRNINSNNPQRYNYRGN